MPTAAIFDLDDTLIDRDASWRAFVGRLSLRDDASIDATHAAIVSADRGGYRDKAELFAELAATLPLADAIDGAAFEALWRREFPTSVALRAGTRATLVALRDRGVRLAIASNGRADMQAAKADSLGLATLVDATIWSGAVGVKKPDARFFAHALAAVGVAADEAIYVGDHPANDVVGAMAAGVRAAWLRLGRAWPATLPPPTWTIDALGEVVGLVG